MVSKRNVTIILLVALFLFSSASCGDSRFQKDATINDKNISIFGHSGNISSNGMKFEALDSTPIQNYMTTSPPQIAWQKCLGGSSYDLAFSVQQTIDEGYIVAGITNSKDGNVSGNHGHEDFWVVKLDNIGDIQWQKCLGGSNNDDAISIQQTPDEGYIVAGLTYSNDGDVSGNHGNADSWLVKIDCIGNIPWQKCLGGSGYDDSWSAKKTAGSGYIVAGLTFSNDGDVNGNHGNGDVWVVKINSPPSTPRKLSGPKSGYIRKAYIYSTSATDPDGDKIKYTFDWGDGTNSVSGFVDSGERVASSHRWIEPGKYCIKVKATDSKGASSGWSKAMTVTETIAFAYVSG